MPAPFGLNRDAYWDAVSYTPQPKQMLFHNSPARFRVPVCGRRFGKSTMAGHDLAPKMFLPNRQYWIVGPTYDLGEKEFRPLWIGLIRQMKLGRDKRVKGRYSKRAGEMWIEMPWGTRLEVRSAQHPESLVGEGLDHVIMSESAKHKQDTWDRFIRPALSDKRGSADFPTTPEGQNWLYQLWLLGQDEKFQKHYESWRFPSWDNLVMYPGGYDDPEMELLRLTTDPVAFEQEYGADFASFVGKIFGEWDDSVHIKRHKFNPAWPNYIAFDWGFTAPLAAIEFQIDPFDNVYIWREHFKTHTILDEHIKILKAREQPRGYRLDLCFGDAADPAAIEEVSMKFRYCIGDPESKLGKYRWREGIDLVKSFLRTYEVGIEDEYGTPILKPKLYVSPDCPRIRYEFNNYKARPGTAGRSPEDVSPNVDDHGLDALRYALWHIYKLGCTFHLADVWTDSDSGLFVPTSSMSETNMAPQGTGGSFFNLNQEF